MERKPEETRGITRREFLRGTGALGIFFGFGGLNLPRASAQEQPPAFHQQTATDLGLNLADVSGASAGADGSPFPDDLTITALPSQDNEGEVTAASEDTLPAPAPEPSPIIDPLRQRVGNDLQELLGASDFNTSPPSINPLGLNSTEVESYVNSSQDTFQSFRVREGVIVVTGPRKKSLQGLRFDMGNIEATESAISRILSIDPNALDGLNAITGSIALFATNPTEFSAGFTVKQRLIHVNELTRVRYSTMGMLFIILTELRAIKTYGGTSTDLLDSNRGIDKGLYVQRLVDRNRSRFTDQEYQEITRYVQTNNNLYRNKPKLA